ncbi:MAG: DNA ligase D [Acidobacteriota bacterium]
MPPRDLGTLPNARKAEQPQMLKPQLATLVQAAPDGDDWLHEIKLDGYRLGASIRNGVVRLFTRNGNDWTSKFESIRAELAGLPVEQALLDGEAVVLDEQGISSFQRLQNALDGGNSEIIFYVFDMIHCDGFDISHTPLIERKELLRQVLQSRGQEARLVRFCDHILGKGRSFHDHACQAALEGIVSKRVQCRYEQRRTSSWVKVKCLLRQEFVVSGYTNPSGSRTGFGALLLGYYDGSGSLNYCGRVGTGFDESALNSMMGRLKPLEQAEPAFIRPPSGAQAHGVHWVRPELVAEVAFTGWTEDGVLRHPSFKGLRSDKDARDVRREESGPTPEGEIDLISGQNKGNTTMERDAVAGVRLSHPDRVLYPGQGLTKQALAEYYESVAEWILPHVTMRPLMILRCPQGQQEECFYQKHMNNMLTGPVHGVAVEEGRDVSNYIAIENLAGLVSLVQVGVLEIHPWASPEHDIEKPDRIIFDLDPGTGKGWEAVIEAALSLRSRLKKLGLKSFVKTSGGKGAHVFVPIRQGLTWEQAKGFARDVAESLARDDPDKYLVNMSKDKRRGKVFLDYLRTGRGSTCVAAYSTRSRPGAPVSAPVTWEELQDLSGPDAFTVENMAKRLAGLSADPWEGFFSLRQSVTREMREAAARA